VKYNTVNLQRIGKIEFHLCDGSIRNKIRGYFSVDVINRRIDIPFTAMVNKIGITDSLNLRRDTILSEAFLFGL
jgi:hypothetical protein